MQAVENNRIIRFGVSIPGFEHRTVASADPEIVSLVGAVPQSEVRT